MFTVASVFISTFFFFNLLFNIFLLFVFVCLFCCVIKSYFYRFFTFVINLLPFLSNCLIYFIFFRLMISVILFFHFIILFSSFPFRIIACLLFVFSFFFPFRRSFDISLYFPFRLVSPAHFLTFVREHVFPSLINRTLFVGHLSVFILSLLSLSFVLIPTHFA